MPNRKEDNRKGKSTQTSFQKWLEKHPTIDKYLAPFLAITIMLLIVFSPREQKKIPLENSNLNKPEKNFDKPTSKKDKKPEEEKNLLEEAASELLKKVPEVCPLYLRTVKDRTRALKEEEITSELKEAYIKLFGSFRKKFSSQEQKEILKLAEEEAICEVYPIEEPRHEVIMVLRKHLDYIFETPSKWQEKVEKEKNIEKQR